MTSTPDVPEVPEALETPDVLKTADAAETSDAAADETRAAIPEPDERLIGAHDLARAALSEITPEATIGEPVGYTVEEGGAVSLRFANKLHGYPGWFWTVTVAVVDDAEPTVLEMQLLPGDDALLAPDWVPWAERLAEYRAAAAAAEAEAAAAASDDDEAGDDLDDDLDDELDDLDDMEVGDFDEDGSPHLHSGDLDGVDIDELDDSDDDDDDDDEDDEESSDEDEDPSDEEE